METNLPSPICQGRTVNLPEGNFFKFFKAHTLRKSMAETGFSSPDSRTVFYPMDLASSICRRLSRLPRWIVIYYPDYYPLAHITVPMMYIPIIQFIVIIELLLLSHIIIMPLFYYSQPTSFEFTSQSFQSQGTPCLPSISPVIPKKYSQIPWYLYPLIMLLEDKTLFNYH